MQAFRSPVTICLLIISLFQPFLLFAQAGIDPRQILERRSAVESFRQIAPESSQPTFNNTTPSSPLESPETKGRLLMGPAMSSLVYQVHVLGEVTNPGTYRITASDRLSEVIMRAGNIKSQGSLRNIEIRRQGEPTKVVDLLQFQLFGALSENLFLLDNDVVYIPLLSKTIQVVGAIKRPQMYELKSEKTLADAIKLAGGFSTGFAKDSSIRVVRFSSGQKEINEIKGDLASMQAFSVLNGDIIVVPHLTTEKNTFDYNSAQLPGDNVFYPSYEDRVFILGGVNSPGAYPFNPFYRLSQYLSLAGGTTKLATGRLSLLNPKGQRKRIRKKNIDVIVINPGDTIVVDERRIPPEGWVGLVMGVAGFGLSTTATVLALTQR